MAFASGPVPAQFERRLSSTAREFERELRLAWPAATGSAAEGCLRLESGGVTLAIELEATGVRRLGLFELPQLLARYRFCGGDEAARRALLARLDRAMQKGGG